MFSKNDGIKRKGVVLLNLGTPDSPESDEVRKYLKNFLMDPFVLDVPFLVRWCIVHGAILPTRPSLAAAAYQKIWTDRGSPLLFHLEDLVDNVQKKLGDGWRVEPAMRYGSPSIERAMQVFRGKIQEELLIIPLYPQYSLAATESSIQECSRLAKKILPETRLKFVESFFNFDLFIKAFAVNIQETLKDFYYDHILFSFHGLPERQIRKVDHTRSHCLIEKDCCQSMTTQNLLCYRAQCFTTARLIAEKAGIARGKYTICFQSRLGRTPWIQPFTDHYYRQLPKQGVKKIAVVCPAFVADCLETLEEVQIRGREEFIHNGGIDLKLVPSLNASEVWVDAVVHLVQHSEGVSFRQSQH